MLPINVLYGSNTGLSSVYSVNVDPSDRIIVGDARSKSVMIFPSSLGNVAPLATIAGPKTTLTDVTSTGVDSAGNIYVTNYPPAPSSSTGESIVVFSKSANGNVKPKAVIAGGETGIADVYNPTIF